MVSSPTATQSVDDDSNPRLTRADAWLLAALLEGSHDGRPVTLPEFVHDADWLNRLVPTFDEVSYGLPRLIAAGYLTVGHDDRNGLVLQSTPKARAMDVDRPAETLGGVLEAVAMAVDAVPYPEAEPPEDRSLGRLPGLEPEDLDAAVRTHSERIVRLSKPLIALAQAISKAQRRRRS